jgi:hypothetical protein
LYNNIVTPSKLIHGTDFHLFKEGIEPKWEDPKCARGGKWTFNAPKTSNRNSLDTYWLNTVRSAVRVRVLARVLRACEAAAPALRARAVCAGVARRCRRRSACRRWRWHPLRSRTCHPPKTLNPRRSRVFLSLLPPPRRHRLSSCLIAAAGAHRGAVR